MLEFVDSIWLFICAIIAMVLLGLIAGFSPTLYVTQIGVSTSSKRARALMISLMIGVLLGIILLSVLFQVFQLDSLQALFNSSTNVNYLSSAFNILIAVVFIIGGLWYINNKPNHISNTKGVQTKIGSLGLIGFGFLRTFVSISGATATFLASNVIGDTHVGILSRVLLTIIFLASTIAPFALILITMNRHPENVRLVLAWSKVQLSRFNYKYLIGAAAILIGSAIIIFNILQATILR